MAMLLYVIFMLPLLPSIVTSRDTCQALYMDADMSCSCNYQIEITCVVLRDVSHLPRFLPKTYHQVRLSSLVLVNIHLLMWGVETIMLYMK